MRHKHMHQRTTHQDSERNTHTYVPALRWEACKRLAGRSTLPHRPVHPPPRLLFSALLEAQEIFGLDFDPAELDQLAKEGLGSDEEEGEEGEEEREEEVRRYLQCTV